MKQLLHLTLGYTVVKIENCKIKDVLNVANFIGIEILSLASKGNETKIKFYTKDELAFLRKLNDSCITYNLVCRRGIFHTVKKYRHRVGIILGVLILFTALYVSPMFVWEINISGIDRLSEEYITELIEKEGVYLGAFSPLVDRKALYRNILRTSNDISWISVNFIGSSANVEVVERDYSQTAKTMADGANIIAKKDGKILDSDVVCGRLLAPSGKIVKKGEILVSGVYETAKSGTRYVYSDAKVYAEVFDEYTVEIPFKNTKKIYGDARVTECFVKMFGKSINIFKNYSILDENYDTINKDVNLPIAPLDELPFSIETVSVLPYKLESVELTEEQALKRARSAFFKMLDTNADYIETLSIEETVTVENSVLVLKCSVEAVENIAAIAEFEIR